MKYNKIYNPRTGNFVNVNSVVGRKTLSAYINQVAGANAQVTSTTPKRKVRTPLPHENLYPVARTPRTPKRLYTTTPPGFIDHDELITPDLNHPLEAVPPPRWREALALQKPEFLEEYRKLHQMLRNTPVAEKFPTAVAVDDDAPTWHWDNPAFQPSQIPASYLSPKRAAAPDWSPANVFPGRRRGSTCADQSQVDCGKHFGRCVWVTPKGKKAHCKRSTKVDVSNGKWDPMTGEHIINFENPAEGLVKTKKKKNLDLE